MNNTLRIASISFLLILTSGARAQIEEIVVTAQKREQNLQDVSMAVSVLEGDLIDESKMFFWEDIDIPGVHVGGGQLNFSLYIRGIGSTTQDPGAEQAVQIYLDGASIGRGVLTYMGLMDLERIEILKGPQPTFFGKNAIAGALNYVSRRPTDELTGYVDVAYEAEAQEFVYGAAISGPVSENLNVRLAVRGRDMDGYMRNSADGKDDHGHKDAMIRASLEWQPSDAVDVYTKFEHGKIELLGGAGGGLLDCYPGFPPLALEDCNLDYTKRGFANPNDYLPPDLQEFIYPSQVDGEDEWRELELSGFLTDIAWQISDDVSFESSTAFYSYDGEYFTSPQIINRIFMLRQEEDFEQFSQEIRFVSSAASGMRWLAGAYYDTGEIFGELRFLLHGPGVGFLTPSEQDNESWSVFGEVDFDLTDSVNARVGGRYTEIKKDIVKSDYLLVGLPVALFSIPPASLHIESSQEESKFTPALTLEWRPNETSMYFASWKEGFKAGGFNHLFNGGASIDYKPEEATSFEVGAKFLFENLRLNITAYSAEYQNLQVASIVPETGTLRVANAAQAGTDGIDLDATWAVTDRLTLNAAISILDGQFDSYPNAQCYAGQINQRPTDCVLVPNPAGGPPGTFYDRSGQTLPFATDWSGSLSAEYTQPLQANWFGSPVALRIGVDVFHTDDQNITFDGDPGDVWEAWTKVNARIGVESQDGRWELAFVGRNLTDKLSILFQGDWGPSPFDATIARSTTVARGRQLALSFRYNFF